MILLIYIFFYVVNFVKIQDASGRRKKHFQ